MKQLGSKIIKDRSNKLSRVFRKSLSSLNDKWKGWEGKVLVLHEGSEVNQGFGRNFAYKNVYINDYEGKFGEFVNVKVVWVDGFNLFANII
jgi:tRNA A37 methylthiotransferase MiaB